MTGMIGPLWLAAGVGILMLLCTAGSVVRIVAALVTRGSTDFAIDGCHAVMGVSMAGMLIPGLGIVRPGASTVAWIVVSSVITLYFVVSVIRVVGATQGQPAGIRGLHHLPHVVLAGAMVYMLAAQDGSGATSSGMASGMAGGMGGMHGGATLPLPTLDALLAFFLIGYTVLLVDRLPAIARLGGIGVPVALGRQHAPLLAPREGAAVSIAMAAGMSYMLVMMFV